MKILTWLKKATILSGLFVISGLFSAPAFAVSLHSFFNISKDDLSMKFLQNIFGQVGGLFGSAHPAILNTMFREFNTAILVLAFFVVVYIVIVSIINTAHQGEFLGKKLDSMWVPLRVLVGILFVTPLPCGYSTIQVIMMWVVIQGVGAADALWGSVTTYLSKGHTLLSNSNDDLLAHYYKSSNLKVTTDNVDNSYKILYALTEAHRLFRDYYPGSTIQDDNYMPTRQYMPGGVYYDISYHDVSYGKVSWKNPGIAEDKDGSAAAIDKGMTNMITSLNEVAKDIVYDNFDKSAAGGTVNMPNPLTTTLGYLQDQIWDAQQEHKSTPDKRNTGWEEISKGGWITAGMYYYDIAARNNAAAINVTELFKNVKIESDGHYAKSKDATYLKDIRNDALFHGELFSGAFTAKKLKGISGGAARTSQFKQLVANFMAPVISGVLTLTTSSGDPLILLQVFGTFLLTMVVNVWGVLTAFLLAAGAAIGAVSYWAPALSSVYHVLALMAMPAFMLISVLFGAAVFMAFYVPLIPYIVFTFAAIGWMIAVFETMLAAPMVAIGIADPHAQHEVLGRAEPALQLLANVFLRPSLMIFGLIGGMILAKVAVSLVMKSFFFITFHILFVSLWHSIVQALIANGVIVGGVAPSLAVIATILTGPAGLFATAVCSVSTVICQSLLTTAVVAIIGFVVMLCMFVLINISIINRCFSLIHLVPDRVLSWLGWQAQFGQYSQTPEQDIKQGFKSASGTMGKFGQQASESGKRFGDSLVQQGSQRGRQANDWNHGQSWKHFFGAGTGKSGTKVTQKD